MSSVKKNVGRCLAFVLTAAVVVSSSAEDTKEPSDGNEETKKPAAVSSRPPYRGTIFIAPDIYLDSDPTVFESATYEGQGSRRMFDRRENRSVSRNAHLLEAKFSDGLTLEVGVNPEFDRERAEALTRQYMTAFGQLPTGLRRDMKSFHIHDGDQPFGGGGQNVLVHIGMGERYLEKGILTETLFHETVHATIDGSFARDRRWQAAQDADGAFISTYARDNPSREDLAETLLLSMALDQRPERLPKGMADVLRTAIPNRNAFFKGQLGWNIDPTLSGQ